MVEDEFFHVPQAQKYCRRDYSWDPKITTPPGLYDDNFRRILATKLSL